MGSAWIVDAVRTPTGKRGGGLASLHAVELGALPLRSLVARTGLSPADVDDVLYGCTSAVGELGSNVGRLCALEAGFPVGVTGVQVNRLEGSSDQALHFAVMSVISGFHQLVVAGGVASATRVPLGSDRMLHGSMAGWPDELAWRFTLVPDGRSADLVAQRHGFDRREVDAFAVQSHRRAAQAAHVGRTGRELLPVVLSTGRELRRDEGIRPDVTVAALSRLPPLYGEGGLHTASTSASAVDASAAVLVASDEAVSRHGWSPRARVVAIATVGVDPTIAYTGPALATQQVLDRGHIGVSDLSVVEIDERFAAVAMGCARELGIDPERVNPLGGALARGHAGGASGAVRLTTLLNLLDEREGRYGVSVVGVGFGQAVATLIERVTP